MSGFFCAPCPGCRVVSGEQDRQGRASQQGAGAPDRPVRSFRTVTHEAMQRPEGGRGRRAAPARRRGRQGHCFALEEGEGPAKWTCRGSFLGPGTSARRGNAEAGTGRRARETRRRRAGVRQQGRLARGGPASCFTVPDPERGEGQRPRLLVWGEGPCPPGS